MAARPTASSGLSAPHARGVLQPALSTAILKYIHLGSAKAIRRLRYSSVRKRRTPGGVVEWYGIVTIETGGCNSARPEGGEEEELMTEEGG